MKERIYISGPIKGIDNPKEIFYNAQIKLEKEGFDVTNPFDLLYSGTYEEYLRYDIRALTFCDSIFMLPNWKKSKGATLEHMVATMIGLKVIDYGG
jgi:hypothetical protein